MNMKKILILIVSVFITSVTWGQTQQSMEIIGADANTNYVDLEVMDWNMDGTPDVLRLQSNGRVTVSLGDGSLLNGLIAHYAFENGNALGTDSSPTQTHNATVHSLSPISGTSAKVGNGAIDFPTPGGGYLELGQSNDWVFGTNDFTVSLWVNLAHLNHDHSLWGFPSTTAQGSVWSQIRVDAQDIHFNAVGLDSARDTDQSVWETNTWYYIAFVRSDNSLLVYLNNTFVTHQLPADFSFGATSMSLTIGYDFGGDGKPLVGQMDDFRIYNRALTATEICELYRFGGGSCL